jgi:hypothetical protein
MKQISLDSEWFLISATWVKQWQKHTYFDCIDDNTPVSEEGRQAPGPIDCTHFVESQAGNIPKEPVGPATRIHMWMTV